MVGLGFYYDPIGAAGDALRSQDGYVARRLWRCLLPWEVEMKSRYLSAGSVLIFEADLVKRQFPAEQHRFLRYELMPLTGTWRVLRGNGWSKNDGGYLRETDFRWRVPTDLVPMLEGPPSVHEDGPSTPQLAVSPDGRWLVSGADR
eukprot:s6311_g1.t1